MRWKIIAVNSAIVVLVGLLSYALLRGSLGDLASNQAQLHADAERAAVAASTKFELDALRTERWLANAANDAASRDVFRSGTPSARQEEATQYANRLLSAAVSNASFHPTPPTLVAVVDAQGIALGRNASNLMRGEDLGSVHPSLKAAIAKGTTASEVWAGGRTAELMTVSYAPVRDDDRRVLGAIIVGTPINDERLQRTTEATSGRPLILGIFSEAAIGFKASTTGVPPSALGALGQPPLRDQVLASLQAGRVSVLAARQSEQFFTAAPLTGYGDGRQAVLIAVTPSTLIDSMNAVLLWPLLGVSVLGVLLVLVGGFLLGNYISRPIEELEEGLLAILNGKTDLRFEIEHPELGGLVFRLNSLLNQLMGVQEDDTDEDGRPSRPPGSADFAEALSVDERAVAAVDVDQAIVAVLKTEPAPAYYQRLFAEYIAAKRSVGDEVAHIAEETFTSRIRASEQDMFEKHGKVVRYRVEVRDREVILLAVPLS